MAFGTGLPAVLCQVLLHTSTLFGALNSIWLELSTPRHAAPSSLLLCFNDTSVVVNASSFLVTDVVEGGDIFSAASERVQLNMSWGADWASAPFFLSPSSPPVALAAAEYGGIRDVLGTDGYYATSFRHQRYDDLWQDSGGVKLGGLVDFGLPTESVPQAQPMASNCVLLTGAWQPGTRYQLTIRVRNPSASASGGEATRPLPAVWLAPISLQGLTRTVDGVVHEAAGFTVRGSKQGTVCRVRPQAAGVFSVLWDPCLATPALAATPSLTQQACLSALASSGQPATAFPYNQPPLINHTLSSFAQAAGACNASTQAFSPRYGGQCVDCGAGTPAAGGGSCTCTSGAAAALVGPTVCSTQPRATTATQAQALGATLCSQYTASQTRWQQYRLSSKVVARLVLKAFRAAAVSLVDDADIAAANATLYSQYVRDDRQPNSPTRTAGIKPSCNKCDGGWFKDANTRRQVRLFDFQFDAMNTFRLIGYLLDTVVGVPCPDLWDRAKPLEWKYGVYENRLCQPLPRAPAW